MRTYKQAFYKPRPLAPRSPQPRPLHVAPPTTTELTSPAPTFPSRNSKLRVCGTPAACVRELLARDTLVGGRMGTNAGWPEAFGFCVGGARPVVVMEVEEGGSAQQAGLQPGDVITELDGEDVQLWSLEEVWGADLGSGRGGWKERPSTASISFPIPLSQIIYLPSLPFSPPLPSLLPFPLSSTRWYRGPKQLLRCHLVSWWCLVSDTSVSLVGWREGLVLRCAATLQSLFVQSTLIVRPGRRACGREICYWSWTERECAMPPRLRFWSGSRELGRLSRWWSSPAGWTIVPSLPPHMHHLPPPSPHTGTPHTITSTTRLWNFITRYSFS